MKEFFGKHPVAFFAAVLILMLLGHFFINTVSYEGTVGSMEYAMKDEAGRYGQTFVHKACCLTLDNYPQKEFWVLEKAVTNKDVMIGDRVRITTHRILIPYSLTAVRKL